MGRDTCPACASNIGWPQWRIAGFQVRQCGACASLFVSDPPPDSEVRKIYSDEAYFAPNPAAQERMRAEHERRLSIVARRMRGGRVLDVGCATGIFLDAAKARRFETFGIEISRKNALTAEAKGHRVFVGTFDEYLASNIESSFDLVSCLDVIEHLKEPREFLTKVAGILRPGGIAVVSTPNYSGPVARVLGENDVFLTPPEHLNFFTEGGLRRLAADSGLRPIFFTTFGRLTPDEEARAIGRYFPQMGQAIAPILRMGIRGGFKFLNLLRSGLELEMYFVREDVA